MTKIAMDLTCGANTISKDDASSFVPTARGGGRGGLPVPIDPTQGRRGGGTRGLTKSPKIRWQKMGVIFHPNGSLSRA